MPTHYVSGLLILYLALAPQAANSLGATVRASEYPALASSLRNLLGISEGNGSEIRASSDKKGTKALEFSYIKKVFENLNPAQQKTLMQNRESFQKFIKGEEKLRSTLIAAIENNVDQNERVAFLARRSAEDVVRASYLQMIAQKKIPENFPKNNDTFEFYKKNQDRFDAGPSVHLWQIFLNAPVDGDEKEREQALKEAKRIVAEIKSGKTSFESAVSLHSQNIPSRANGGYMGLLELSNILPEIKKQTLALKEGKLSEPVVTDAGVHILKRGTIVDPIKMEYETIKPQLEQLMLQNIMGEINNQIYELAHETYPITVSEKKVEEWYLQLKIMNAVPQ